IPIGRQLASGLSLLLSARRFFTNSAAHGCSGNQSSCVLLATFPRVAIGGAPGEGVICRGTPGIRPCQRPDKSGLPSAVRGTGASKSTPPLAVRGTRAVFCAGHWARSEGPSPTESATPIVQINVFTVLPPGCSTEQFR